MFTDCSILWATGNVTQDKAIFVLKQRPSNVHKALSLLHQHTSFWKEFYLKRFIRLKTCNPFIAEAMLVYQFLYVPWCLTTSGCLVNVTNESVNQFEFASTLCP